MRSSTCHLFFQALRCLRGEHKTLISAGIFKHLFLKMPANQCVYDLAAIRIVWMPIITIRHAVPITIPVAALLVPIAATFHPARWGVIMATAFGQPVAIDPDMAHLVFVRPRFPVAGHPHIAVAGNGRHLVMHGWRRNGEANIDVRRCNGGGRNAARCGDDK
jgi:hypothetical protein